MAASTTPRVRIIEQPTGVLRFRYMSEGRLAGSILGASSTSSAKTYPAIKIEGYQGRALVIVSCVTKDEPYRPHPHKLVGKEGCNKGVCSMEVSQETMTARFTNLGIQCTKKRDVKDSLKTRKEIKVDPFNTGFSHANTAASIDLTTVRLCFQVLLDIERKGKFTYLLDPVVSEPIIHERAVCDFNIVKLSKCVCPVDGGIEEIILVCDKISKNDIQVRFFEEKDGQIVWEGFGDFKPSDVYKQVVMWFKPPPYKNLNVVEPVNVFIQLQRPSDGATSEPLPFQLLPLNSVLKLIRKSENSLKNHPLLRQMQPKTRNGPFPNMNIPLNSPQDKLNNPTPSPSDEHIYNGLMYTPNLVSHPPEYSLPGSSINITSPVANPQPQHSLLPTGVSLNIPTTIESLMFNCDHLYTPNLAIPETHQYRTPATISTPPSAGMELNNLSFPNTELHTETITSINDALLSHHILNDASVIMQNGLDHSKVLNSVAMDIDTPPSLSGLLNGGNQSELQLLNLDSGELDTIINPHLNDLS